MVPKMAKKLLANGKAQEVDISVETNDDESSPDTSSDDSSSGDTSTPMALRDVMQRMNKIHQQHHAELREMWQAMNLKEQSDMLEQLDEMLEIMESMDMSEHMEMIMNAD